MMMGFGFIGMILFGGIIIVLAVALISLLFPARNQPPDPDVTTSAVEILQQRYARGEISGEEYQKMRRTSQQ
jgi:putative membrane protein